MSDLNFVQNDTAPSIFGTLTVLGTPVDLTGAQGVRFQMRNVSSGRYTVDAPATVVTAAAGAVRYDLEDEDLRQPGAFIARWQVTFSDGSVQHSEPENTITVDPA